MYQPADKPRRGNNQHFQRCGRKNALLHILPLWNYLMRILIPKTGGGARRAEKDTSNGDGWCRGVSSGGGGGKCDAFLSGFARLIKSAKVGGRRRGRLLPNCLPRIFRREVCFSFLFLNTVMVTFGGSIAICWWLKTRPKSRRSDPPPQSKHLLWHLIRWVIRPATVCLHPVRP